MLAILELIFLTGAIGPAMIVAGFVLWHLGVRDPFLLTCCALVIGVVAGWPMNLLLNRKPKRKRTE